MNTNKDRRLCTTLITELSCIANEVFADQGFVVVDRDVRDQCVYVFSGLIGLFKAIVSGVIHDEVLELEEKDAILREIVSTMDGLAKSLTGSREPDPRLPTKHKQLRASPTSIGQAIARYRQYD